MKKYLLPLALLALVPSNLEAQGNGCNVCEERSTFHWVEEPPVPVFEGIAETHGIMLGGCDSHTHLWICCWCDGLTEAQQEILRDLMEYPAQFSQQVRENLARYFMRLDATRFAFLDPNLNQTPDKRFAFKGCNGEWNTISLG